MNTRESVLELLTELASPLGPEVFAGFGTEFQNRVYEDNSYPEKFKDEWEKSVDPLTMLPILIDIAKNPPSEDACFGLHIRRSDAWEYHLRDLLYRVGRNNLDLSHKLMRGATSDEPGIAVINDAWSWIEEEEGIS